MRRMMVALTLVAAPQLAVAQAPAAPPTAAPAPFDPARLALARTTVDGLFPPGSYGRMMRELMGGGIDAMMGSVLDMSAADLGMPGKDGNKPDAATMRAEIRQSDPHFEERMRIMTRVMGEEMGRIGGAIEPAMRDGLARAVARRFTAAQLADINRFFATDSGRAFGRDMLLLWVDPETIKAMMSSIPAMIKEMPAAMKRIEAATAHLPKPKPKAASDKAAD